MLKNMCFDFFRLNTINEGRVAIGDMSGFVPCTPNGCIELIKKYVKCSH